MYTSEQGVQAIREPHLPSTSEKLSNTALKTLGIRSPHLVDSQLLADVTKSLGLEPELIEFVESLETRRGFGRALHTLQEGALIAGIGQLGTMHPEAAIPLFSLSLVANGAVYVEASRRDRLVGTVLKRVNARTQELNVGRDTEQRISTAIQQATPLLSSNERMMYSRPGDLVLYSAAEMLALGLSKPEAIPWLAGGVGLLVANMEIVSKLYSPKQAAFLKAEKDFIQGDITFKDYTRYVKDVSNVTFIINSITRVFKSMGMVLGSTMGLAGVMLSNVDSASGNIAKNSQDMIGATQARETLDHELKELLITLESQIKTQSEYDDHTREADSHSKDKSIWLQLLGSGVKKALISDMEWAFGSEKKQAQGVIDFSKPEDGAFYIFGENGTGKSTLVRSILQMDKRHDGFVGLWQSDDKNSSSLTDLHSLNLSQVRDAARMFSVSGIRAKSDSFLKAADLDEKSGKLLLEKYGFEKLSRLLNSDISSLTDKSEGEQIILGVLSFLENARKGGAKLVVLDEIFGKVDQNNVSKMKRMIDDYVSQGLMTIVVAQDPFKMGEELSTIRGAVIDYGGLTYYDESIFHALAKLSKKQPSINIFKEVVHPKGWISALGMSLETDLTDEKVWDHIIDNPGESIRQLELLFGTSTRWADETAFGLLAGFRSYDPVEIGYISTGMIRKWERIFSEESQTINIGGDEKQVLSEARSLEYISELKLLKQIFGLLKTASKNHQTEASIDEYSGAVTSGIKHVQNKVNLTVSLSWFDDEMRQFIERENKTSIQPHNLADMILGRDLYWDMDSVPSVHAVGMANKEISV